MRQAIYFRILPGNSIGDNILRFGEQRDEARVSLAFGQDQRIEIAKRRNRIGAGSVEPRQFEMRVDPGFAARRTARRALAGAVFADVGGATHYHTDWMVPYWRDSLTKIARIRTHLFYVRSRSR